MIHRILTSFRSAALIGAVSFGLRKRDLAARAPQPVYGGLCPEDEADGWMFERQQTDLASGAYMLEQAYSRAAGNISVLRSVLSGLAHLPELREVVPQTVDASLPSDPMLFDEDRAVIVEFGNVVAFEDDDLFADSGLIPSRRPSFHEDLQRVA